MTWLIAFAVANVIIASVLNRKQLKVATSAHAVLFTFLFFLTIITSDVPWITAAVSNVFSVETISMLSEAFGTVSRTQFVIPALIVEVVFIFETVFSAMYIAWRAADFVITKIKFAKKAIPVRRTRDYIPVRIGSDIKLNTPKFCYLYCSMLC